MRIVFLNPFGGLGGAELCLLDLIAALRPLEATFEPHLIVGADGPLLAEATRRGARCHLLPLPTALNQLGDSTLAFAGHGRAVRFASLCWRGVQSALQVGPYVRRLQALITQLAPDLIHSNGLKYHVLSGLLRRPQSPVLWHIHDFLSVRPLLRRALPWATRNVCLALANSDAVAADVSSVLPKVTVQRLYNGIDLARFAPGPGHGDQLDALAGLTDAPAGTVRIGLVATYARWKGQDLFLQAAQQLSERSPQLPVRFYIVGGPIYHTTGSQFSSDELRALANGPALAGRVGFIPFQTTPEDIYRALDVVVHASTRPEPFGRTIVEAMACARPVIVAQAGGAAELFTSGVDALGVRPNDAPALADAMRSLVDQPSLRERLAQQGRASVCRRFDRQHIAAELLQTYRRLLPQPGRHDGTSLSTEQPRS